MLLVWFAWRNETCKNNHFYTENRSIHIQVGTRTIYFLKKWISSLELSDSRNVIVTYNIV